MRILISVQRPDYWTCAEARISLILKNILQMGHLETIILDVNL